jgi:hypothetical protein
MASAYGRLAGYGTAKPAFAGSAGETPAPPAAAPGCLRPVGSEFATEVQVLAS